MSSVFDKKLYQKLRFALSIILSCIIMIFDSKYNGFIKIKYYLDVPIGILYHYTSIPSQILHYLLKNFRIYEHLISENQFLYHQLLLKKSELLLLDQYKQENIKLLALLGHSSCLYNEKRLVSKVIGVITDVHNAQILIDKGIDQGVCVGQPVVNDVGVVGQVISTSKLTSRVLLICDVSHGLPIKVLRNNDRFIIVGKGYSKDLQLINMFGFIDIQVNDILVTSGLDSRFPEGYPVAIVSSVKINSETGYTFVQARPIVKFNQLSYVLLLFVS